MSMDLRIPRAEHPRPDFKREAWMNLNGTWEFEMDYGKSGVDRKLYEGKELASKITVPFCPESDLSGIGHKDFIPAVWYKRSVALPKEWVQDRVILHFGAVDYEAKVWVNGKAVGSHRGGYTSFAMDITDQVVEGENTIMVYAEDDTRSYAQPSGKQSREYASHGCSYTRTTGIWQTVWLERVSKTYIKQVKSYPNIADCSVTFEGEIVGHSLHKEVCISAHYEGKDMGQARVKLGSNTFSLTVPLAEKHLWEPGYGRLYDLKIQLWDRDTVVDEVASYIGLRQIELVGNQVHINGKSVFQRLVLDQGFYADGIYTAPTEEALIKDIQISLDMGFNGARLHEKIFEPLFIHHANKMGYMVWGEFPDWGLCRANGEGLRNSIGEWMESVERDFNHPSIVGWCFYNETSNDFNESNADQDDEVVRLMYQMTKLYDKTRPVIDTSGWNHVITDIYDIHNYSQDPDKLKGFLAPLAEGGVPDEKGRKQRYTPGMPFFVSEYGGIKWVIGEDAGWGYGNAPKTEEEFISRYRGLTEALLMDKNICAFCYTQLYDVEQEVNGLYTYADRKPKFDPEIFKAINSQKAAIED